jgi:hypothetical protein
LDLGLLPAFLLQFNLRELSLVCSAAELSRWSGWVADVSSAYGAATKAATLETHVTPSPAYSTADQKRQLLSIVVARGYG